MQYTELKCVDPDSRQSGTAVSASLPGAIKMMSEERRELSDKIILLHKKKKYSTTNIERKK